MHKDDKPRSRAPANPIGTPGVCATTRESGRPTGLALLAVVGVALLLRLDGLGQDALWLDEANTWIIAREPLAGIVERLRQDASPPLYYFFLHGWMKLFGDSAWALRLPSVLAGVALVVLTYRVGRSILSPRAAIAAAWLVAVSPSQIFHAEQVRMYSWLGLVSLYATHRLMVALDRTSDRDRLSMRSEAGAWALYAATLSATLLTHNFAFHLIPAHACIVLVSLRPARAIVAFTAAGALTCLLYAPWLPVFIAQLQGVDTYSWYAEVWAKTGPWSALLRSLDSIGPLGQYFPGTKTPPLRWLQIAGLSALFVAAAGAWIEWRDRKHAARLPMGLAFALPIVTSIALSCWLAPHFVPGRVDQMVLAPLLLLVGAGLNAVCPRGKDGRWWLSVAALVTLAAALLLGPHDEADAARDAGAREARGERLGEEALGTETSIMDALAARARPGDRLICTSLSRAPLEHLLKGRGAALELISFPRSTGEHMGGQEDALLLADPPALEREAAAILEASLRNLHPGGTGALHVILMESPVNDFLIAELDLAVERGQLVETTPAIGFLQRGIHHFGVLRSFAARP